KHLVTDDSSLPKYCNVDYLIKNYINIGKSINHIIQSYTYKCNYVRSFCFIDGIPFWYLTTNTNLYSYGAFFQRSPVSKCKYIYIQLDRGNETLKGNFVDIYDYNETGPGRNVFYSQIGTFTDEDFAADVKVSLYGFPGGNLASSINVLTPRSKCEFDAMHGLINFWIQQRKEGVRCTIYKNNYMQVVARQFCERALQSDKENIKQNIGKYLVYIEQECIVYFKYPQVLSTNNNVSDLESKLTYIVPIGCSVLILIFLVTFLVCKRRQISDICKLMTQKPDKKVIAVVALENLPTD
uniref:Uncharacterized protein n=2 Tax=Clytia hemisphaerica TaxID=252671 RepID=A0A7M5WWW0_9CNID